MAGIYVHLPFCPYICPYCDFAKWPHRKSEAARYLDALNAQIERAPAFEARTLFFGGGTPNTYAPRDLAALVTRLRQRFAPGGRFAETTIELNPDPPLTEGFSVYREAGIDRLSFGVQSFVERELEVLGRRHRAADVKLAFERARAAGIDNLSLDLIFAVPGQTPDSWRRSLEAALALEPAHLSTYGLTIEEGTPYAGWFARAPGDFMPNETEAELYAIAIETLGAAGFEHYEISNFARPGRRSAHNANYWDNGEYLGLGVGAASYRDGVRSVATRELAAYCEALREGRAIPEESERLEGAAKFGEAAMLALRRSEGVDVAKFSERYGVDFLRYYEPVLERMRADGLLQIAEGRVALTGRGRFVANDVCAAFVVVE